MPENENLESSLGSFAPLIGQKAQGCWLGYASALFLEFGEPQPLRDREKHPRGEWSLWSDQILWRVEQGDRVLAGCEDDDAIVESATQQINGRILLSGQISEATGDSILEFTDYVVIKTFVPTTEEDARWNFRQRGGDYVTLGPKLVEYAGDQQR
jgi:hypothetical protein